MHSLDGFVRRQHSVSQEPVVDECRRIAIAPDWVPGGSCCVHDYSYLESLFDELAHMGFDAHVRQHPAQDDPADPALTQLEDQVVGLRPEDLVRADDHGPPVFDVGLEAVQPVYARVQETGHVKLSSAGKRMSLELGRLERTVHPPPVVSGVEVMRRDEDLVSTALCGLEDSLHVFDRLVLRDARPQHCPVRPMLTQDVILRVDENDCRVGLPEFHVVLRVLMVNSWMCQDMLPMLTIDPPLPV